MSLMHVKQLDCKDICTGGFALPFLIGNLILQVTYIHLPHYSSEFMHQPHKFLDIIRKQGCGILVDLQTLKLDINDT